MPSKPVLLIAAAALLLPCGASAQTGAPPASDPAYQREVFEYPAASRRDPFRSLLNTAELGIRVEDLSLRGVVFNPADAARSVAVLEQAGTGRRYRVRAGDRVGSVRVLAVAPGGVDLLVEELGVARRETLQLRRAPRNPESGR